MRIQHLLREYTPPSQFCRQVRLDRTLKIYRVEIFESVYFVDNEATW